ncbi:MAG: cytochrome c oxidase subunit II [Actinomycetota bacterium]|nr:cytochrome c oxidase subunit II [Actinomycetota bacterium]
MPGSRLVLVLAALFGALVIGTVATFILAEGAAPPDAITDSGDAINQVYWVLVALAAVIFLLVEVALIAFIIRFRRRRAAQDLEGPQIHGNTRVEVAWTLVPALLLLALAIYTFLRVPAVEAKPGDDEDPVEIAVTAHQFYWQYEYPNGALSFDVLYLPAGRTAKLVLRSEDVDHSWWVPELTGKRDAIPGQHNELFFEPRREGVLETGVCGEFCGIQHARMTTRVEVVSPAEFERWQEENAFTDEQASLEAVGKAEWDAACAKCHGFEGEGDIGPPIAGSATLTDQESLRRLLFEGQNLDTNPGYMPPVGKGWSDRQIRALIAYVESNETLAGAAEGGGGGVGGG